MSHVITLIGAPGAHDAVSEVAQDLKNAVRAAHDPVWLSREACDITFAPNDDSALEEAQNALDAIPGSAPIDRLIQPIEGRRKRMLVADMDATIIEQESLDEVAAAAGMGEKIAAITERAMRGELVFEEALRQRIELLRGFPQDRLQEVLERQIGLARGARELVTTMRVQGAHTVLVSGGFTFFTNAIAQRAGFDIDHANRFLFEDGALSGVAEPIIGREAKFETMRREAIKAGFGLKEVIAVGDGANDLDMLKAAGLGVAFHAKPVVAAQVKARIDHGDLTALLFLQGYRSQEFATDL